MGVKLNIVLFNVGEELICSKNFSDPNKLVEIVFSLEEWFFLENHAGKHATKWPDIETVVVNLEID